MNITGIGNSNQWGTLSKVADSKETQENKKSIVIENNNKSSSYAALEKSREDLIKSRQELSSKEMDPEEKKAKIDDINKQIAQLEAQIQQAKTIEKEKEQEKLKEKIESNQSNRYKSSDEVRGGVVISESLKKLIESRQSIENIGNMKVTKASLSVERGWLTPDGNKDSFVTRQYEKLSKGISGLEQRISSEASKVYKNATNISEKSINDTKIKDDKEKEKISKDENKE